MTEQDKALVKKAKYHYLREWRKKNPDKWKAIQDRYILKRALREGVVNRDEEQVPN